MQHAARRWRVKERRKRAKSLPAEYDFSVTSIGIAVICVVIAVMFTV